LEKCQSDACFNVGDFPSVPYIDPEVAWVGPCKLLFDDSPASHAGESIGMAAETARGSCTDFPL
jgi:hypothetical protein